MLGKSVYVLLRVSGILFLKSPNICIDIGLKIPYWSGSTERNQSRLDQTRCLVKIHHSKLGLTSSDQSKPVNLYCIMTVQTQHLKSEQTSSLPICSHLKPSRTILIRH